MAEQTPELGDTLGSWSRETGFPAWNRFAAVNDEFIAIHMDDAAAREAGMPAAFGMGNLLIAYQHELVRAWLPASGLLTRYAVRFRKPAFRGRITVSGSVTAVVDRPEGLEVELALSVVDADGDELAPGTATVMLARP